MATLAYLSMGACALGVSWGLVYLWRIATAGTGYKAKVLCSNVAIDNTEQGLDFKGGVEAVERPALEGGFPESVEIGHGGIHDDPEIRGKRVHLDFPQGGEAVHEDAEINDAWAAEVERRGAESESVRASMLPAADAIVRARADCRN